MGMGHGANYADVIEFKNVKEICPEEMGNLITAIHESVEWEGDLSDNGMDAIDSWGNTVYFNEEDGEVWKEAKAAYEELQSAFKEKTGLELYISYHDSDERGDCYDDVTGVYFYVDGMYQMTIAGETMKDKVERKMFVTFG